MFKVGLHHTTGYEAFLYILEGYQCHEKVIVQAPTVENRINWTKFGKVLFNRHLGNIYLIYKC